MKFLDTTWKATQEAAKQAGYITGYKVITVEARGKVMDGKPGVRLAVDESHASVEEKPVLLGFGDGTR